MLKSIKTKKNSGLQRSNTNWIRELSPPADEQAIDDLRKLLVRGLKPALYAYKDRELNQFVEDVVQDALLKILDNIHTFRGDSKFTSWAIKIAVREGLSELRRKKWQDISIQDLAMGSEEKNVKEINSKQFSSGDAQPDRETHENLVLDRVMQMINHELSDKQKQAIIALKVQEMPTTVVADRMGIKRNALYKLIHDARVNLKDHMSRAGIDPENIFLEM